MDLYDLLTSPDERARQQALAQAAALRGQMRLGQAGQLSGDKVLAPMGGQLVAQSLQGQQQLGALPAARQKLEAGEQEIGAGALKQKLLEQSSSPEAQAASRGLIGNVLRQDSPGLEIPEGVPLATMQGLIKPMSTYGLGLRQIQGKQNVAETKNKAPKVLGPGAQLISPDGTPLGQRNADRPASGLGGAPGDDMVKQLSDSIEQGHAPPDLKGLYRMGAPVRAELQRRGFDLGKATQEWNATTKHIAAMNGTQQERLSQAMDFTTHSLDQIEGLYNKWQQIGPANGFKTLNKASLWAARQMPGEVGATAQALLGQINDMTAELGNVYMGGNSPTDHALSLAGENLKGEWNDPTFKTSLAQIRQNLKYRMGAIAGSRAKGLAGGNRYETQQPAGAPPGAIPAGYVKVSNGKETHMIPPADVAAAAADGFRAVP